MSYLISCAVLVLVAGVAFYAGHRSGYLRGFQIANGNNKNLINQLKGANDFATDLRIEEREREEKLQATRESN